MHEAERMYRLTIGFDKGYLSIPESKLAKAVYAKMTGGMFFCDGIVGEIMEDGRMIMEIKPDYHYYTGWDEDYIPKSKSDFQDIKDRCPNFRGYLTLATDIALDAKKSGNVALLDNELLLLQA